MENKFHWVAILKCNHCPFARRYEGRLNAISSKYTSLGFPLLAISSTDVTIVREDAYLRMVERARKEGFHFPYLFDSSQQVAHNFSAAKTPHAFIIAKEGKDYVIRYSGAIDDNGDEPEKAVHHYLTDALEALLAGKPVPLAETKSIGCSINYRKR
ncbi:MAG: thioredoxin family protein [Chitinophagia bacterium]|nr:thioredoxin family protein [Chitinophagia bacterium]